jgi:hypothetical protein
MHEYSECYGFIHKMIRFWNHHVNVNMNHYNKAMGFMLITLQLH